MWNILFKSFQDLPSVTVHRTEDIPINFFLVLNLVSGTLAPFIGWLADVRFGRYEIIKFGSLSILASILFYFELLIGVGSTLTTVLYSVAVAVQGVGGICFI